MRRRVASEPYEGPPVPELVRGPLMAHVQALYDATEVVPEFCRDPRNGPLTEQAATWRMCRAFRRAQDARQAWFTEHGYTDAKGHVDWHRFRAEQLDGGRGAAL